MSWNVVFLDCDINGVSYELKSPIPWCFRFCFCFQQIYSLFGLGFYLFKMSKEHIWSKYDMTAPYHGTKTFWLPKYRYGYCIYSFPWDIALHAHSLSTTGLGLPKLSVFNSAITSLAANVLHLEKNILALGLNLLEGINLYQINIRKYDNLQGYSRLYNWLFSRCFLPWINQIPPVC